MRPIPTTVDRYALSARGALVELLLAALLLAALVLAAVAIAGLRPNPANDPRLLTKPIADFS